MVSLSGVISRLHRCKVLVIGDLLLDTYTIGKARRISPEAPVAVIHVEQEESRPGGAGNVMLNLASMGAEVVAVGRIGEDSAGRNLKEALEKEAIHVDGLVVQPEFFTPVKQRVIAENQQIVRVDYERVVPITEALEQHIIKQLPLLLEGISLIAISDYGKGFLSEVLLSALIKEASVRGIPLIADPKGIDFTKYNGVTVIKPNLSEAYAAANLPLDASLDEVAARVLQIAQADTLMITRAEAGISLFHKDGSRQDFPVLVREVKDVTGAGDTVLAMLAFALANHLPLSEAVSLSNIAAGIAIERLGCARVTLAELARRLLEEDVGNKVFDGEHLFVLKQALQGRTYSLLGLSGDDGLTSTIFLAIRRLSQESHNHHVIVYLRDHEPDEAFVSLLASLHDVKFIIDQSENLYHLCDLVVPSGVYTVNARDFVKLDHWDLLLGPQNSLV